MSELDYLKPHDSAEFASFIICLGGYTRGFQMINLVSKVLMLLNTDTDFSVRIYIKDKVEVHTQCSNGLCISNSTLTICFFSERAVELGCYPVA